MHFKMNINLILLWYKKDNDNISVFVVCLSVEHGWED